VFYTCGWKKIRKEALRSRRKNKTTSSFIHDTILAAITGIAATVTVPLQQHCRQCT